MFVLRTVGGPDKPQTNTILGKFYTISYSDSLGFKDRLKELRYKDDDETLYAIIESELNHPFAIIRTDSNYIMLGDGSTFANISDKR